MTEEKIIVTIHDDGSMEFETKGIKGPLCEETLQEIMKGVEQDIIESKKTPEYYQKVSLKNINILKRGK